MKFKFAAASIISMPIRMKIAWRRLSAASKPMENTAAETIRKSWRVGLIVVETENAQRAMSNAQRPSQRLFGIGHWALRVERRAFASSLLPLFLHNKNQRAD